MVFALAIPVQLAQSKDACSICPHLQQYTSGGEDVHLLGDLAIPLADPCVQPGARSLRRDGCDSLPLLLGDPTIVGVEPLWSDIARPPARRVVEVGKV